MDRFRGVVGYHMSLTHSGSPVRTRAETAVFLLKFLILDVLFFAGYKAKITHELSNHQKISIRQKSFLLLLNQNFAKSFVDLLTNTHTHSSITNSLTSRSLA
jgi:hypothetical protein